MNIRAKALETYKKQVSLGMQDTAMNWHIWKRAFDIALKQSEQLCQMCKSKDAQKEQLCDSCWGDVNA